MAFDREAAKADGYTDEEIDQFLATKDQPLPPETPRDRSEEQMGVATSAIPAAVGGAVSGIGLYKGAQAIGNALANRGPAPIAPVAPPAMNPAAMAAVADAAQTAQAMSNPSAQNFMQRASALAAKYAPVAGKMAKGAGVLGAGIALGQGLFGTSPEEIAMLKAADERKRQAAMNQIPR
jgi:hypothetical protein